MTEEKPEETIKEALKPEPLIVQLQKEEEPSTPSFEYDSVLPTEVEIVEDELFLETEHAKRQVKK